MRSRWAPFLATTAGLAAVVGLLAAPAGAAEITLLQVNDWDRFEEKDGRGGYARLLTILEAENAAADNVLFIHAGDAISPSLLSGFDQGAHMIELLNTLPLDLFILGNHEFDFGPEVAAERVAEATFDVVNSNVRMAEGELFPGTIASKLIEVEGFTLGFYGLTTPDTMEIASPGDTVFEPVVETAERMRSELEAAGADLVIAAVHTGWGEDMTLMEAGVADLIMTGHDHDLRILYDVGIAMVESASQAEYVTAIDLTLEREDDRVSWRPAFRTLDSAAYAPSEVGGERIQPYLDRLSEELDVEIGETLVDLDTRRSTVRSEESNFGNLVADAMRAATGADVGLTNGGGIRGDRIYEAGHILTRRDVLTELPFGNVTVLVEVSGADLLEALENGFSRVEDGAGRFPQVSGMSVVWDPGKPAGNRVVEVTVGGEALDPEATYKIATNDYMLGGGDGYTSLADGEVLIDPAAGRLMANTVADHIAGLDGVAIEAEGRIVRRN